MPAITRVLGHPLPGLITSLMASGEWGSLRDAPGFRALCERYGAGHDPRFHPLEAMSTETRNLGAEDHPVWRAFFLGVPDASAPPGDLDPDRCVLFADLGQGSDVPLALDYRCDPPRVLILDIRHRSAGNRWVCLAADFREFYEQLVRPDPA